MKLIREACRYVLKETFGKIISWVVEEITVSHRKKRDVMMALEFT